MAGTKEIRVKIASIKSTQKITKAMETVAASKMRRAQERMRAARPYADRIRNVIGHLRLANPNAHHPFLVEREVKAVGIIVVSVVTSSTGFANGVILLGIGTAMVYPTLLATVGDVAHPSWRASSNATIFLRSTLSMWPPFTA